jgi:hypothetical protein
MNKKLRAVLDRLVESEHAESVSEDFPDCVVVDRHALKQIRLLLKIEDEKKDLRKMGEKVR